MVVKTFFRISIYTSNRNRWAIRIFELSRFFGVNSDENLGIGMTLPILVFSFFNVDRDLKHWLGALEHSSPQFELSVRQTWSISHIVFVIYIAFIIGNYPISQKLLTSWLIVIWEHIEAFDLAIITAQLKRTKGESSRAEPLRENTLLVSRWLIATLEMIIFPAIIHVFLSHSS